MDLRERYTRAWSECFAAYFALRHSYGFTVVRDAARQLADAAEELSSAAAALDHEQSEGTR